MVYKLILVFTLAIIHPYDVHAKLLIKRKSGTLIHSSSNIIPNRRLKEDKNGGSGGGGGEKAPSPPSAPAPAPAPFFVPTPTNDSNDKKQPEPTSKEETISFSLQPVYLTLQSPLYSSFYIEWLTKTYIQKYFEDIFKIEDIDISIKPINNNGRRNTRTRRLRRRTSQIQRKRQQQRRYHFLRHLNKNSDGIIYEILSSIQFQNKKAPTAELMENISQTIFDDEYLQVLVKNNIISEESLIEDANIISFTNPLNDDDNKTAKNGNGGNVDGASSNGNSETINGDGSRNKVKDKMIGGVIGSVALLCVASMMFVKMKRNKNDDESGHRHSPNDKSRSTDGHNVLFDAQIFARTLRRFNIGAGRRYDGDSSDEEDLDHDHHSHTRRRKNNRSLHNACSAATTTSINNNTDIVPNDDASAFETVYSTSQGHIPISPSLQQFFTASPNHKRTLSTLSKHDDVYSLDGSFAIDNRKPNMGEEMLDHVLSMNDYDSTIIIDEDDHESSSEFYENGISNSLLNESSDIVSEADASTFSFSNHVSNDVQSDTCEMLPNDNDRKYSESSSKRQKIEDLLETASIQPKQYYSPQKSHIIVEGISSSNALDEGVDIVRVSPSNTKPETPMNFISSATSFFNNLIDSNANQIYLESSQLNNSEISEFADFDNLELINGRDAHTHEMKTDTIEEEPRHKQSLHLDAGQPARISSRIVETERTEAIEIKRGASTFSMRNGNLKITVETSAPPPPKTPSRYPFQDINQAKHCKSGRSSNSSQHGCSDSESSNNEQDYPWYFEDESINHET